MASNVTRDHHNLRRNLKLNGNYISNDGGDEGITVSDAGLVTVSGDLDVASNMTISDNEIDISSGDLTLNVDGAISLDAAGTNAPTKFLDSGSLYAYFQNLDTGDASRLVIYESPGGSDYFQLLTTAAGLTTMVTKDNSGGVGGHLTLDADGDITLDAAGDNIKMLGSGGSGLDFIQSGTGDYTIKNLTSDKDIIFNVNDGTVDTEVMRLDGSRGELTMATGTNINFGDPGEYIYGNGTHMFIASSGILHIAAGSEIDFANTTCGFTAQTGTDAVSIDWGEGNKYHLLLETSSTVTFATNPTNPCNLLLKVQQGDGGSKEITWDVTSGTIYWAGGGILDTDKPTLTTADDETDILSFYFDGTN